MVSNAMEKLRQENVIEKRKNLFGVGDAVKVSVKIHEGDKERVQVFAGTVIARDGGGSEETFTVRRISHGVGVERVFPLHSPHVTNVKVEKTAHVRKAKLYFLRDKTGKKARLKDSKDKGH
jgi:large subunit ribosomal protein L19